MFVSTHGITARPTSSAYGTLTTAWIAATGETDLTILGALNTLESDLTTYGLTSKMKALYPMVGGTAGKHSYNFMNTAQYQITWAGGITHSSTGVLFNGTNSYGDTNLNVNSVMTLNSTAFGIYNRTDSAASTRAHGVAQGGNYAVLFDKWSSSITALYLNDNGFTGVVTANTDAKGFYQGSRTASNALRLVKNTTHTTSTAVSSAKPNGNFFIGAQNNIGSPPSYYNDRQVAFTYLSDGLTQTECDNFYTAVQTFQTTLSRQV